MLGYVVRMFRAAALLFLLFTAIQAHAGQVLILNVEGIINTGAVRYIERGVKVAQERHASLIVIKLNTPGGLLNSTREIVQKIGQSKTPVAVYVTPGGASATSAGTIIAMSAHYNAMAPGTNIGAAHPVGAQGEDIKGKMDEKATNDTVAFIKSQASLRGRNQDWAEKAIRQSISATAEEAFKANVVDFIAPDLQSFLSQIEKKQPGLRLIGEPVVELEMTYAERLLKFLGDPNVSYLLMLIGGLGLYVELTSPGVVLPGVLGAIAIILALLSFSTLPVNYGAVALLFLGILFLILEAFVTSYGVLTIGGIASLILGSLFLMDASTGDLRISLTLVIPTVLAVSTIMAFIALVMWRSRKQVYAGLVNFVGLEGVVQSVDTNGKSGKVLVRGEVWDFDLDTHGVLNPGDRVVVQDRKGFRLVAQKATEKN